MRRIIPPLAIAMFLAGCGPKLDGELIAGRTVSVTNREESPVTLIRIVANDSEGRQECVDSPATTLGAGRTYSTTFFLCDEVTKIAVETSEGVRRIGFDS